MNEYLAFQDVLIEPKFSNVKSRSDVNLSSNLKKYEFTLPIISANMPAVTNSRMAIAMNRNNALGILHRFNDTNTAIEEYKNTSAQPMAGQCIAGVSMGVKEEAKRRFEKLYEAGARVFCIDAAHGHQETVKQIVHWINNEIFKWDRSSRADIVLIAGNIATSEAALDLWKWGADAIKVGIGPGSACTTRLDTGVGVPQLAALKNIYKSLHESCSSWDNVPKIIADGGCTCVGDIAKSLKYADMVMLGKMLAGSHESAAPYYKTSDSTPNLAKKVYYGSASYMNKNVKKHIEGRDFIIDATGAVSNTLQKIEDGLRSAFSYVGASNLEEFQKNAEFIKITNAGRMESKL